MAYAKKVVLYTPRGMHGGVEAVAHQFVTDGVKFVACVGPNCELVEDIVDWVAIEHGSPERNFILTSSHPNETVRDAIEFASGLSEEYEGEVQVVEI